MGSPAGVCIEESTGSAVKMQIPGSLSRKEPKKSAFLTRVPEDSDATGQQVVV